MTFNPAWTCVELRAGYLDHWLLGRTLTHIWGNKFIQWGWSGEAVFKDNGTKWQRTYSSSKLSPPSFK